MTTLQILGSGCANCVRLAHNTEAAAKELGMEFTIEKVTDIQAIVRAGVMKTPALVVDGRVKLYGRVPNVDELKTILA
ncbi:MAG TPA: thioredoxin family protein [Edaphobacter sp.]|uniref:thioredoxin family protein n=1 Tax=Edaphobacter sp. TaxID=1934404 RepID=UPI002CFEAB7D|nr:thioredoxin family protein [Edaphobacter sp.]HUZ95003.1 thioredoxin family protein [Edaphobacter sp.]